MAKKTIREIEVKGKRVLIRADFNVPLTEKGKISNDRRIRCTVPTIKYALDHGASVILMSHLGRPSGDPKADSKLVMDPVAARLADLLDRPVRKADQVVGSDVSRIAKSLKPGEVFVLENLRFDRREKDNDDELAVELAKLAEFYVNDAFGSCQNLDASMVGVPKHFPPGHRVMGLLLEKELATLDGLLGSPAKPMISIMGGAKVSDKIQLIQRLIDRVDKLLIGGAMAYTFLVAAGKSVGKSRVETDHLDTARSLAALAGAKLVLPTDHVVCQFPDGKPAPSTATVISGDLPADAAGVDIGPATVAAYQAEIAKSKTIVWNGPVGLFECEPFSKGSRAIAEAMVKSHATTVVGGGETAEAVERFDLAPRLTHVSTGGGAFLTYLGGDSFESLRMIDEK